MLLPSLVFILSPLCFPVQSLVSLVEFLGRQFLFVHFLDVGEDLVLFELFFLPELVKRPPPSLLLVYLPAVELLSPSRGDTRFLLHAGSSRVKNAIALLGRRRIQEPSFISKDGVVCVNALGFRAESWIEVELPRHIIGRGVNRMVHS